MQNNTTPQNTNTKHRDMRTYYDPDEVLRANEARVMREEIEELKQWGKETKVNAPVPKDLLPILAKDPANQIEIAMEHMELGKEK